MNKHLEMTDSLKIKLDGTQLKAVGIDLDMQALDTASKRRNAVIDLVAKQFAKVALKMSKAKEEQLKKEIKFLNMFWNDEYMVDSFSVGIGEKYGMPPFFSMVSVQDPKTGKAMIVWGFLRTPEELMQTVVNNNVIKRVNMAIDQQNKQYRSAALETNEI